MQVHAILAADLGRIAPEARLVERLGFDGMWVSEIAHDPFLPLAVAAGATRRLTLGTAIAVALPRSPMHLATLGYDLHRYSGGRFVLGLGSQVRAHVERRFSAQFDRPAARMRELVLAVRAIWASWQHRTPLDFRGEFYTHTLMSPFFDPGPNPYGVPQIFLAAVGPGMLRVAGEVADGVLLHGLSSVEYLRRVARPALAQGAGRAGRDPAQLQVGRQLFLVTGRDAAEQENAARVVRERLGFYAATPGYRVVLDCHGWAEVQPRLAALAREGEWARMGESITDEMLRTFAVVGSMPELAELVAGRFAGLVDRVSFAPPLDADESAWAEVVAGIHAAAGQ